MLRIRARIEALDELIRQAESICRRERGVTATWRTLLAQNASGDGFHF